MVTAATATQELIEKLIEMQEAAGLSDRAFAREKLGGRVSHETWGKVKSGQRPFTLHFLRAIIASYPRMRPLVNRVVLDEPHSRG